MDIHEYQAKEILARFGVPIPRGGLAYSPEQASYRCTEIGGAAWVGKTPGHARGRGGARGGGGGDSDPGGERVAQTKFGRRALTTQYLPPGKPDYRG